MGREEGTCHKEKDRRALFILCVSFDSQMGDEDAFVYIDWQIVEGKI